MKLTVKLSKPNKPILELIRQQHGLTGPVRNWNGIANSELYYGSSGGNQPSWVTFLAGGTETPIPEMRTRGAIGLLFIPMGNRYMLFTFGYGNHKIPSLGWEKDFGLKVVLNSIDPNKVKSLDAKTVDTVVMSRRVQLSKENKINDFGFEIDKDFLKSLAGAASDANFASVLSGSENLSINCDVTLGTFAQKAADIYTAYNSTTYQAHYSWVDNIKAVTDTAIITALDDLLVAEFNSALDDNPTTIDTACPEIVDYAFTSYYKFSGYRDRDRYDFISIASIIESMAAHDIDVVDMSRLESIAVQSFDGNDSPSGSWPLADWLTFECDLAGNHFIRSDGTWYQIEQNYFAAINRKVNSILRRAAGEYLPLPVTVHQNEEAYITNYTATSGEFIFDRALSYVYGVTNSIEICDIYNNNREFIHIKDGGSSSKLSHLFNQGYVSASLFIADVDFRQDIVTKLTANRKGALAKTISTNPNPNNYTIVYRILKTGATFSLPFFTKVVLVDMYRKVKSMGYKFRLEWVRKQ